MGRTATGTGGVGANQNPVSAAAISRQATIILALLYGSMILSYVDRAVFALSLKPIKAALALSDVQLGLLTGLAFAASYAVFSPLVGWLGDRRSRKAILMLAILIWSSATVATAFAHSFGSMFVARGLVGMGEAAVLPLALSLLSDTRPDPHYRHRAFGIFMTAGMLGNVSALLFGGALFQSLPPIAGLAPWQSVFVLAGVLGLVMIALIAAMMADPSRGSEAGESEKLEPVTAGHFVRTNPGLIATLYLGTSFLQMGFVTSLGWIIVALERRHDWTAGESGVRFALTAGPATILGALIVPWMIRALRARGVQSAPLLVCMMCAVAFAVLTALGLLSSGFAGSLALITAGFFFGLGGPTCAFVVMGEAIPPPIRTQLAGFNTLSNAAICNTLGAYLVGLLSDRVFTATDGVADSLATVSIISALIGSVIVIIGLRTYPTSVALAHGGSVLSLS